MNRNFKDGLNLLKHSTPRKLWNATLVLLSYLLSKRLKRPIHWGMPTSISIEPTTSCNLRCPECPSGLRSFTRPTGMLEPNFYKKIIDELAPTLQYLVFYFQGEPYLNKDFLNMVNYAHKKGVYTATSTNAHYLDEENAEKTIRSGLDRLIISIDGTSQETYQSYRVGGKLDKVIEGTKRVVAWKKKLQSTTPHIIFQFLVVAPNEHQIEEVYKLAQELGVDEVALKTAQIYDYEQGSPLIPKQEQYSRYKRLANGTYVIKNKLLNQCWKMWSSCVITWDGKVVPCCFDKDATHTLGELKSDSFTSLWRNEAYNKFRKLILLGRSKIDICKNCTEGTTVWAD